MPNVVHRFSIGPIFYGRETWMICRECDRRIILYPAGRCSKKISQICIFTNIE